MLNQGRKYWWYIPDIYYIGEDGFDIQVRYIDWRKYKILLKKIAYISMISNKSAI